MDNEFGAFIGGVAFGVFMAAVILGALLGNQETACRKEHNVFKCERVYLPAEVGE